MLYFVKRLVECNMSGYEKLGWHIYDGRWAVNMYSEVDINMAFKRKNELDDISLPDYEHIIVELDSL